MCKYDLSCVSFFLLVHPPSVKLLIAIFLGFSAMYCNVASSAPSRIIKWITIRDLNTMVHVESRSRNCSVRNISATPTSPASVATKICSIYLDLGAASYVHPQVSDIVLRKVGNKPRETTDFNLCSPFHRLLEILGHCSGSVCERDALEVLRLSAE